MEMPSQAEITHAFTSWGLRVLIQIIGSAPEPRVAGLALVALGFSFLRSAGLHDEEEASDIAQMLWDVTHGTEDMFATAIESAKKIAARRGSMT